MQLKYRVVLRRKSQKFNCHPKNQTTGDYDIYNNNDKAFQ